MGRSMASWSAFLCLALAGGAYADVVSMDARGFALKTDVSISAKPMAVYDAMFDIDRWWNGSHTYSGSAANLKLEKRPGGCFCEALPDGGFVKHSEVTLAMPAQLVRIKGGLGPVHGMGGNDVVSFAMKPEGEGTRLTVSYIVSAYSPGTDDKQLATAIDGVIKEQVSRLKKYVETGKAD